MDARLRTAPRRARDLEVEPTNNFVEADHCLS